MVKNKEKPPKTIQLFIKTPEKRSLGVKVDIGNKKVYNNLDIFAHARA